MKKMLKLFALILAVCTLLTCGLFGSAEAAKRDDLNISVLSILATSDPHASKNLQDMLFYKQVYEPLVWQNEATYEFEWRIAESYTVSDDGLTCTFKLRKGVKFHNGDLLKASDVVFSLLRLKTMTVGVGYADDIADVVAVDDGTVNIILKKKSAAILSNLGQLPIISEREVKEQGEAFGTKINLAGTGPYYLTYLDRAVKWDCQAFPDYYKGEAPIKYLHYKPITDAAAGLIAFESGELDWYIAPITDYDALVKNEKYNTELAVANHISYLAMNWLHSPLENDKLREAIAYAVDKDAMNITVFDGHARIADFMERPGRNVGAPSEGVTYSYNPEKARQLVIEAGFEKGVDNLKILTISGTYFEKMAQVLQAGLADIGVTCSIELYEAATGLDMCRKQQFDLALLGYNSTGDYSNLRRFVHSATVGSYSVKFEGDKFDYKRFDELFDLGGAELDPVKRAAIYKEVNDLVMKTFCLLPIFNKAQPFVWAKNLNVPVNYPDYPQIYEWSWKD
ncbi:diguanylate phosphodiesterase [Synergistales bacterium]|nr:diguanylate phosphodiesterase [Synergistales bacterium]